MTSYRLDEAEFKRLTAEISAIYPEAIRDEFAASIWYRALKDIPYKALQAAFELHMQSSPFPPKPADLRAGAERLVKNTAESLPPFEGVWRQVTRALRNSSYHAEEEFDKLPAIAKEVVVSPENLQKWAVMDIEELETVQKSLSRRNYDTLKKRKVEDAKLSLRLTQQIEAAAISYRDSHALTYREPVKKLPEKPLRNAEYSPMPADVKERLRSVKSELNSR